MNNIKRVLSVVLCTLLMISMLATCQLSFTFAATEGDYTYTVADNGKDATITGYKGTAAAVEVPAVLAGYNVVAIADEAFANLTKITSVSLPAKVASIGNAAFRNCSALQSVTMPTVSYTLGDAAFMDCVALKQADLRLATEIGVGVLSDCSSLTELTLPAVGDAQNGVSYMAILFDGIANAADPGFPATLKTVTVTADKTLEASAFKGMSHLKTVTFTQPVTTVGENAFNGCAVLESVNMTVNASVIGAKAFYGCKALTAIDISNAVTTAIGASAFEGCAALATINASATLKTVGKNAVKGTKWLASQADGAVMLKNVFITYKGAAEEIEIPATATSIADSALEGNTTVVALAIPATVSYIGTNVLKNTNIAMLSIPYVGATADDKETSYISYLFGGNDAAANATALPKSLSVVELTGGTAVAAQAFGGCKYLQIVTIPSTVAEIKAGAFANCPALIGVGYDAKSATVAQDAFSGSPIQLISFGENVKTIPTYLCTSNANLTYLEIPASVTRIESRAFAGCYNVESVAFDAVKCEYIAADAFDYCHKLSEIELGENVTYIPANLFSLYGSSKIEELTIPENITSIAAGAFANCVSLKTLNYNAPDCTIGDDAFSACAKLVNINLGKNVTTIPANLYSGNTGITTVKVPAQITRINDYAFSGCSNLKEITVPETLSSIGENTLSGTQWYEMQPNGPLYLGKIFYGYKGSLDESNSVEIAYGTTAIADGAFKGNGALKNVTIPSTVTAIGKDAFAMTTATITLNNPAASQAIIDYANENNITLVLDACAHNNVYYVVTAEPEAGTNGTLDRICKDCGEKLGSESYLTQADLADKWVLVEAPTCTVSGVLQMGDQLDALPATGHTFVTWKQTKAPTCTEEGQTAAYCSVCGKLEGLTGTIKKLEHTAGDWQQIRLPRTYCTGLNAVLCTECGEIIQSKKLPKLEEGTPLESILDVIDGTWYHDTVEFVMNNGFFNGIDANTFGPDEKMTRAMFVTVLGRLAGVDVDNNVKTAFKDIKKNQYYTGYVKWAADNGIVNGISKTEFAPNANITREQICAMIVRYSKYADIQLNGSGDPTLFRDADEISKYALDSVLLCHKAGIVKGRGNSYFAPKANATRAEVAQVLQNLCLGYLVVE